VGDCLPIAFVETWQFSGVVADAGGKDRRVLKATLA
jgi:hypothetical protein